MLKSFFGAHREGESNAEVVSAEDTPFLQGMETLSYAEAKAKLSAMNIDPKVMDMLDFTKVKK